jgi:hypothetical protein
MRMFFREDARLQRGGVFVPTIQIREESFSSSKSWTLLILKLQNKRWKAHHQYYHDLHQLFSLEYREEERRIGLCITFHRKIPKQKQEKNPKH